MAVLCGLSLRASWISCLLISSVTCFPAKEYGSPGFSNPAPSGFMAWTSGFSSPNAGGVNRGASQPSPSGGMSHVPVAQNSNDKPGSAGWGGSPSGSHATGSNSGGYPSNAGVPNREYYAPIPAHGSQASPGYAAGFGYAGYGGVGSADTGYYSTNSESTGGAGGYTQYYSEGDAKESPEPVFSDVSDLEPVYSYSSRSSYQRGRDLFSQTRYTPGAGEAPPMIVARNSPNRPAQPPAKGGF